MYANMGDLSWRFEGKAIKSRAAVADNYVARRHQLKGIVWLQTDCIMDVAQLICLPNASEKMPINWKCFQPTYTHTHTPLCSGSRR